MNTLTLSVKQRLLLRPLLPVNGRRIEMIIIDSLAQQIEFSAEEVHDFELKDNANGFVSGNAQKFRDKMLSLTNEQIKILKDIPAKVDEAGKVTIELLPLLDMIDELKPG